jgi:hypothetical protein
MPSNPQLLYAILSMDTYHQGSDGGLNSILIARPTQIDNTSRLRSSDPNSIGFSAQVYSFGSSTVIAYRGTDDGGVGFGVTPDRTNGSPIAVGETSL